MEADNFSQVLEVVDEICAGLFFFTWDEH